ncbi:MAG: class I SAM-dependent DNA methyltransferase [Candidatus Cryosericum sp.]
MAKTMRTAFDEFNRRYSKLDLISADWYKKEMGVVSFAKTELSRSASGKYSEEYLRARFVYALIASGKYSPELLCVEAQFPKGNGGKSINPDILAFKDDSWQGKSFSTSEVRQNLLVIFEAKRSSRNETKSVIEKQLRTSMNEYEGDPNDKEFNFVFGVYFDDQLDVIIFKKEGDHPLKRYNPEKIREDDVWNIGNRDSVNDLPSHDDLIARVDLLKNKEHLSVDDLDPIDEYAFSDLLVPLNRAKDKIGVAGDAHTLIVEFLTYKVFDEKYSAANKTPLRFYITNREIETSAIQNFRKRFKSLQEDARSDYPNILTEPIFRYNLAGGNLQPNNQSIETFLIEAVRVFETKSILKANNESFNQIIFNNFGSSMDKALDGQFFTPIPAARMMVDLIHPGKQEAIVDPCSGICDFLAVSFRQMHSNDGYVQHNTDAKKLFGFDKDQTILKLAELNLVLNGDGGATIQHMDSLTQKMCTDCTVLPEGTFNTDNYSIETWEPIAKVPELMKFDVVITNPPFGRGRDLTLGKKGKWDISEKVARMYETYWMKKAEFDASSGRVPTIAELQKRKKTEFPNSMDTGALFLENAVKVLVEGGRMAVVVSTSIASIEEWENVRAWFLSKMRVVAAIDLPSGTFGETSVATTVLVAYKPKSGTSILTQDYKVFTYEVNNIGYEVKIKKRLVVFEPRFHIDETTFTEALDTDGNKVLLEDFSDLQEKFTTWVKFQESGLRKAFNV